MLESNYKTDLHMRNGKDAGVKIAVQKAGSVQALARRLRISRQAVDKWTQIPVNRIAAISRLFGIPREVLRPDIFR